MNLQLMQKINPNGKIDFASMLESNSKTLIRNIKKIKKPVVVISSQTFCDAEIVAKRNQMEDKFRKQNIPVFNSIETMAKAILNVIEYKQFLEKEKNKTYIE